MVYIYTAGRMGGVGWVGLGRERQLLCVQLYVYVCTDMYMEDDTVCDTRE